MVQQKSQTAPHRVKPSFDVYDGDNKYVFITYAHKDAKSVFSDLEEFNDLGINIFYDDGLPGGSSWFETLENKIINSSVLIPFMSKNTVESKPSRKEIFLAFRTDIPILPIYIKPTTLKNGLDYAIGDEQSIFKYEMCNEDYIDLYVREFKRLGLIDSIGESDNTIKSAQKSERGLFRRALSFLGVGEGRRATAIRGASTEIDNEHMKDSLEINENNEEYRKNNYIYVSYSNNDIGLVIPEIERYVLDGYEIKFDKGLSYNDKNEWPKFLDLIGGCGIFVVFLSENAVDSNQVKMELKMAYDNNKIIIPIYLEETELNSEFKSILKSTNPILKYEMNDNDYCEAYTEYFDDIL